MTKCNRCGGKLRRIHRTFVERLNYLAVYECIKCQEEILVPRHFRYHLGPEARCPKCGTLRVTKLKERDKIDGMHTGVLNLVERFLGGSLHHCRFCRLQFYDRRKTAARASEPVEPPSERNITDAVDPGFTIQRDTARLDV